MEIEKRVRLLNQAEKLLESAIQNVFDAAKKLEEADCKEEKYGRMFDVRNSLEKKINSIKDMEKIIRNQNEATKPKTEVHASDCDYWVSVSALCNCVVGKDAN